MAFSILLFRWLGSSSDCYVWMIDGYLQVVLLDSTTGGELALGQCTPFSRWEVWSLED